MPNVARTKPHGEGQVVYAEMCTAADYEDRVIFYCPNPDCDAQLTLCAYGLPEMGSRSPKPYFARKTGPMHVDGCSCNCSRYSQSNMLTNEGVDVQEIFLTAITPSEEKPARPPKKILRKGKKRVELSNHPIRTLRDLVNFCRFHHPDTFVSEQPELFVKDILIDDRVYKDEKDFRIDGHKIIRGEIFRMPRSYFDETYVFYNGISMSYPCANHGECQNYHMCHAKIADKKLYDSLIKKLGKMPSSGSIHIAIYGEWSTGRRDGTTGCRKYNCTIHSRDQIIVIRDPRW